MSRFMSSLTVLAMFWSASAEAALINIDVNGRDTSSDPSGGDGPAVTYTGSAVAGGGLWNSYVATKTNLSAFDPPGQGPYLTSIGAPSGVSLDIGTVLADNLYTDDAPADGDLTGASGNMLMDDYVYYQASPFNVNLSGLIPGNTYDLWFYASPGEYTSNTTVFTIGANVQTATNGGYSEVGPNPTGFVLNKNYVFFNDIVATGGVISVNVSRTLNFAILNGMQIEGVFVPEPSAMTLGLLAFVGVARLLRRPTY